MAEIKSTPPKKKFTRKEWLTLYVLGSVHFASSICISLQAPFYPAEAEEKGASSTVYGLVFGVFEIVSFISSPIFGKYLNTIGVKFTMNSGIVTAAVCCVLFGLLDMVDSLRAFVALSFCVRIVESLGAAAALTAAFAITASVFKDSIGTTFATLEVFYGVGYIMGPTVGGVMFSIGGFRLPFIVTGTFLAFNGVLIFFVLPEPEAAADDPRPKAFLKGLFKVPAVILNNCAVSVTASTMGYYAAILEPHLREFSLTPVQIGLMFVISGTTYAMTAPLIGWLCDHGIKPKHACAFGNSLVILGCCLIGPAPFFPSPTVLWLCILGLMLHGLGVACILVSCFIDSIKSAILNGCNDDICTYGLVSGLWASSFSLGAFIGPSAAGALYDWIGFRMGTIYVLATQTTMLIAVLFFICFERTPPHRVRVRSCVESDNVIENGTTLHKKLLPKWAPETRYVAPNPCQAYGSFNATLRMIEVHSS